jgi:hypothetical protein
MFFRLLLAAVTAGTIAGAAFAQVQPQAPAEDKPDHQDKNSTGTSPEGMGSTGWSGGLGGARIGTTEPKPSTVGKGSTEPASQETATGAGLTGSTRLQKKDVPE